VTGLVDAQDTRWMEVGRCAGYGDDTMFPEGDATREIPVAPTLRKIALEEAKAVCSGCQVISECLAYAMANGEPAGVWGGLDAKERDALLLSVKSMAS
jgi:WhiB family transcriptional regulator, redox-sensing transcriptional regulator